MLYWAYSSPEERDAGALRPVMANFSYGAMADDSPFRSGDYSTIWRAIRSGYVVQPGDCGPTRLVARYGIVVHSPGTVTFRRLQDALMEREFGPGWARYGVASIEGDPWPHSDSELVGSWITGSEFVKLQTGILIYFPASHLLLQAQLPNSSLVPEASGLEVMTGAEYPVKDRDFVINGVRYGIAGINVIVRLPPVGEVARVERGQPIVWCLPILPKPAFSLERLPAEFRGAESAHD